MGHVIRRHAWDRVLNDAALRVASAVTLRAGPWGGWMRQNGVRLLRTAERIARLEPLLRQLSQGRAASA